MMWFILACSIIAFVIILERLIVLRQAGRVNPGQFMMKLKSIMQTGDLRGAVNYCTMTDAPLAYILRRGIMKFHEGHEKIKEAIENAGKEEIYKLEKHIGILASIAGIAPMLGFLGTVTGMISAFQTIASLQGAAGPGDLAGGIWEALLTTAFGLMVGIPAYGAYNYFVTRIRRFVFELESHSNDFLDLIQTEGISEQQEQTVMKNSVGGMQEESLDDVFQTKFKMK
jgi:biopolymer transport protein ExbB